MGSMDPVVSRLLHGKIRPAMQVPILTRRLELRPFAASDVDGIADLLSDPEATKFIGSTKSRQAAAESVLLMRDAFVMRGFGTLAVVPQDKKTCVGYCGVRPLAHTAEIEIAFALQKQCWNQGYATEAAEASIDAAFKNLSMKSIVATVYPDNRPSLRVLEKLGMRFECEVFGHWPMTVALLFRLDAQSWQGGS